jgi:excisionase family DNA binding protein
MARTPELMRTGRAAQFLGVHRDTLRKWQLRGFGPPRTRMGKSYWYSREALKEWLRAGACAVSTAGASLPSAGKTKASTNGGVVRYHR